MDKSQRAEALRKAAEMRATLVAFFNTSNGKSLATDIAKDSNVILKMEQLNYKPENLSYILSSMTASGLIDAEAVDGKKVYSKLEYKAPAMPKQGKTSLPEIPKQLLPKQEAVKEVEIVFNGTTIVIGLTPTGRTRITIID